MRRSQPVNPEERILKRLGIKPETEEEKAAGRVVIKTETVDRMFDFDYKPSLWVKLSRPFRRFYRRCSVFKRSVKQFWKWRKLFEEYHPWSIAAFLPMFIKHLELYIELEKTRGISTPECIEYKISTAQEAIDIMRRLVEDDYSSVYTDAVEEKWGKFPYEKTTYANGSTGFLHLTPEGYSDDFKTALDKGWEDEQNDLKRLGELIEKNMMDWWD